MSNPEASRYLKTHEWVHVADGVATVGISEHAQKEITDVIFIELPEIGRKVGKGESVAVVESVKAAFDIYAPVSGEVIEVNEELAQNPALVNQSPHDKGWFYRLKASAPAEAEELMNHAKYQDFLKAAAE